MVVINALFFDIKDLPNKFLDVTINKCSKCNKQKNSNFCEDCGTKIEPTIYKKVKINVYDFMEEHFKGINHYYYGQYKQFMFINVQDDAFNIDTNEILVDDIKKLFTSNLEEDTLMLIVINKLKELNIPYKNDFIIIGEY